MLYNIREYHRPTDIAEAFRLLQRTDVNTVVLAGGINVTGLGTPDIEAVVDLGGLGLDFIDREEDILRLGAMVRLQTIVEELGGVAGGLLADCARRMAGWHVRNMATLGGALASGDIHTPLSVALAALRARVELYEQAGEMPLWADLAGQVRTDGLKRRLITAVTVRLPAGPGTAYEQVARTPADHPIVCAASVAYPTGDDRFDTSTAVGGLLQGAIPVYHTTIAGDPLAAVEQAAAGIMRDNVADAAYCDDFLGSSEYRRRVVPVLVGRSLSAALKQAGAALQ